MSRKVERVKTGKSLATIGPHAIAVFSIETLGTGTVKVVEKGMWQATQEVERLGEPALIRFSPHGGFLATAHSPTLQLEGARPSSVSLWYTEEVDSRDGDTHRGHRLLPYASRVEVLDFSLEGDQVLTADADGTVRIWKII